MGLSNYYPSSRLSQAGVCTSSTRPASPYEGQMIYETDTNRVLVYDNTAWVMIADTDAPPALQLVKSQSFTNASTAQINDCFTGEFRNYKVLFRIDSTNSNASRLIYAQVVNGTTPETGTVYSYGSYLAGLGASTIDGTLGSYSQSSFTLGNHYYSTFVFLWSVDVFEPQIASTTTFIGNVAATTAAANQAGVFYGAVNTTTQYEGLIFTCGTGTMTGTVSVYGYRN